jgi:hypothetical protein
LKKKRKTHTLSRGKKNFSKTKKQKLLQVAYAPVKNDLTEDPVTFTDPGGE